METAPFKKKGSARIAINAWKQAATSKAFRVLPVSLNYNSFTILWKKIIIEFGEPIVSSEICFTTNVAHQITQLNNLLYSRLKKGILTGHNTSVVQFLLSNDPLAKGPDPIDSLKDIQVRLSSDLFRKHLYNLFNTKRLSLTTISFINNLLLLVLLFIPAFIGILIHLPIYLIIKGLIKSKTKGTVFYDSALFASLLIVYPLFLTTLTILCSIFINHVCYFMLIAVPFFALTYLYWKECFVSIINYVNMPKEERKILQEALY